MSPTNQEPGSKKNPELGGQKLTRYLHRVHDEQLCPGLDRLHRGARLRAEVLSDATGAINLANTAGATSAETVHATLFALLNSNWGLFRAALRHGGLPSVDVIREYSTDHHHR